MRFVEQVLKNVELFPEKHVLADSINPKGITYKEFIEISGKVYAYLSDKGIGREDIVMLSLPRGIQPLIAEYGVLRNGSAFLTVEDTYEPARVAFMKQDCNCKIVIDSNAWEEIQRCPSKRGYVEADEHDAAMIVYTSGSTGNPKGVLHEYGNLDRMIQSGTLPGDPFLYEDDRFALVAPLNFIASQLIYVYTIFLGVFLYVVPYDVVKNPMKIGMFLMTNKITGTFLTPSHIRKMKVKFPSLRMCVIGSEPAHNVFMEGLLIHNCYLMSESGFMVTHQLVDKCYENTPVGKNEFGHEIILLDENGEPVKDGEEGEVCFENKYVRGYIGLPEETKAHFIDNIYHTGDLAYKDEEGRMVISGRLSEMVKVNGNRVEPGEIETVAARELKLSFAACRIFQDERSTQICVYYTDKKLPCSTDEAIQRISKFLPYYMLPNAFIHIDQVPLKPNGKMDRKALPKPQLGNLSESYVAPADDIEEKLCAAFEKALDIKKIGTADDFYQMGGDSLATMEVLVDCGINGLNASDIFKGRTPAKIAQIWRESHPDNCTESMEEIDERARDNEHRLLQYQTYMLDYQMYTPYSTMLNLNVMFKFDFQEYEPHKLIKAIETTIQNHPALMTKFCFDQDSNLIQKYDPSFAPRIHLEKISAFDFRFMKDDMVKPFKILNSRLYRCRVFDVEGTGYVFFDVHHTVFDGTSFQVLLGDILKSYDDMQLERDCYYGMLEINDKVAETPRYESAGEYFHKIYDGDDFVYRPECDHESRENSLAHYSMSLQQKETVLEHLEKQLQVSRNAFFNTVSLLAIAMYNKKPNVQMTWTYNGRDELCKNSMIGLLLKDLPIMLRLEKESKISTIYKDIQEQIAEGIANSCYPYTMMSSRVAEDDRVCFLYQRGIRDAGGVDIETVEMRQNNAASENIMDVQLIDDSTGLSLLIDYMDSRYDIKSVERFARIFGAIFEALAEEADNENARVIDIVKKAEKMTKTRELWIRWMK